MDYVLSTGDYGGSDKLLKIIFKYFTERWWKVAGPKKTRGYILEDLYGDRYGFGEGRDLEDVSDFLEEDDI